MNERNQLVAIIEARHNKYRSSESDQAKIARLIDRQYVLSESIDDLSIHLSGIPYAVIGGQAAITYGSPRTTADIDYLILPRDLERAQLALGGQNVTALSIGGVSMMVDGVIVDLITIDQPWAEDAINSASGPNRLVSRPYLVLMKLWSSRGADEDMYMAHVIRGMSGEELEATRKLVVKYLPNDIDDLDSLIKLSRLIKK